MNTNTAENLLTLVPMKSQFSRSARIDQDSLNDDEFIYSGSIDLFLNTLAAHQESKIPQGAYTWTGPYGSGKSTLALSLLSILTGPKKARYDAAKNYNSKTAERVWAAFPPRTKGWRPITIVGERTSLANALATELKKQNLMCASDLETPEYILAAIHNYLKNSEKSGGLFVVIDEMGKLLEHSVATDGDVYLYQLLAEAASRSAGRFVFVGILHQTFQEYSSNAIKRVRDEWGKVQGRFVDISLNLSSSEQIELISATISSAHSPYSHQLICENLVQHLVELKRAPASNLSEMLKNCWPLNPITALCLGPVSRRSYGQNQRSIFSFLGSGEPLGFKHFLQNTSNANLDSVSYSLAEFWDYLSFNWSNLIASSQDSHSYAVANENLAQLEKLSQKTPILLDPICEKIIKTVHILQITRPQTGLHPNRKTIHLALGCNDGDLGPQILALQEANLINYRRFNDTFTLHEGSDFDIEVALKQALEQKHRFDLSEIGEQFLPSAIVAKRHYFDTGTLRWADIKIGYDDEIEALSKDFKPTANHFARFLFIASDDISGCLRKIRDLEAVGHFALGLVSLSPFQLDTIQEYSALKQISETQSELSRDKIARREVNDRIDARRQEIENIFSNLINKISWISSFKELNGKRIPANKLVSLLAERLFPKTIKIRNELVNRSKTSGSASRALKQLMYDLLKSEHLENLGYTKYPAERGIFTTIFESNGLHKKKKGKEFQLINPSKNNDEFSKNLSALFLKSLDFLKINSNRSVSLAELYQEIWQPAPFGLKMGPVPLLSYLFIKTNQSKLAYYRQDIFITQIEEIDIDYIIRNPELCSLRYLEMDDTTKHILTSLAAIPARITGEEIDSIDPLHVARKLIEIFDQTPSWALKTAKVSDNAKQVRTLFKRASDPAQFALIDIPNLYGEISLSDKKALRTVFSKIEDGLNELSSIMLETMSAFQTHLLKELGILSLNESSLEELKARAQSVKRLSGDNRMEMFITNIEQLSLDTSSFQRLASMLVTKPAKLWIDNDIDKFFVEATDASRKFVNLETMAHIKGNKTSSFAYALVSHQQNGSPAKIQTETLSEHDLEAARELIKSLRSSGFQNNKTLTAALALMIDEGELQ
jgi:hypothetical protein